MRTFLGLVLVLTAPFLVRGENTPDRAATVRYLQLTLLPDGASFGAVPNPKPDLQPTGGLRATSAAIRALKYFGGEIPTREATAKFVKRCYDEQSGGFSERPGGKPDVALTAIGLMAVAELKLPKEQFAKAVRYLAENAQGYEDIRIAVAGMEAVQSFPAIVRDWHKDVLKSSNGDGIWGKDDTPRATGGAVALLLRSGGKLDDTQRKNALEAMRQGQRDDGGFGKDAKTPSELETTYRIMRAFHLLGEKPKDVDRLKTFIAKCRNADAGYGVSPGQPSSVSGCYYAGSILHWLEGK